MRGFFVAAIVAFASAHPQYVPWTPNAAKVPGVKAIGHIDPNGGGIENIYGLAFLLAGKKSTSWSDNNWALCKSDSDADNQTNGFEMGDPCCTWTFASGQPPAFNTSISNPGNPLSVSTRAPVNCSALAAPFTRLRGAVSRSD